MNSLLSLKNGKDVNFPTLWFTIWFEDEVRGRYKKYIKKEFRENFLINTFHVLRISNKFSHSKKSFSELLRFKGGIMLDSGGFLFQKSKKMPPSVDEYLDIIRKFKPDVTVAIDFPLNPLADHENKKRIEKTLENLTQIQMKSSSLNINVVPVIHGFDVRTIEFMLQFIERNDIDLSFVGLGSLVPLIRHMVKNGRKTIVNLVVYLRQRLPSSILHVFGIGGTTTMHIMFFMGVNSIDSAGWEKKAGNGVIQLPGIGDRFLSKKSHHRTVLKPNEIEVLRECQCPVCVTYDNIKQRIKVFDEQRDCRVVHNGWVYQREVDMAREMIENGTYEYYIENVLQSRSYKSLFNYARNILQRNKINKR